MISFKQFRNFSGVFYNFIMNPRAAYDLSLFDIDTRIKTLKGAIITWP